ncbi:hypothetical protein PV10_02749 [Exophiala mesophila]|uniref:Zn(2)-C6 fungal-type domain-containing protein n=1 Tax=Exophiala mesophila TaxID=212818 RepID=A0A0D2A7X0_EXOME|nr:uncharacterized protein PV10_02749 [Exophiala mesophila]KIV95043.1 hypothetical protein PV10_02749 [Exophiala mesophila]
MVLRQSSSSPPPDGYLPRINRACQECNRKKVKCDMGRPSCGLCRRTATKCTFRMRQKPSHRSGKPTKATEDLSSSITAAITAATSPHNSVTRSTEATSPSSNQVSVPSNHGWSEDNGWQTQAGYDFTTNAYPLTPGMEPNDMSPGGSDWSRLAQTNNKRTLNQDSAPCHIDVEQKDNGWHIPTNLANELIELFFENVHGWVPIIHRPSFYQKFMTSELGTKSLTESTNCTDDAIFMINAIFSLSARFSKNPILCNESNLTRGNSFATAAASVKEAVMKNIETPSLDFVKGCILLAFYHLNSGELSLGSPLTSVCVRFAYDLGVDGVDGISSSDADTYPEAWIQREELRRIWWSIWELDTFVATLSRQPYAIARGPMDVFLPVSDDDWFSGIPTESQVLDHRLSSLWRSLENSKNQCHRAWFLISNYLMSCAALAGRQTSYKTSPSQTADLQTALCCLKLAIPTNFHLHDLYMDKSNFVNGNWIVSTHLMIIACETILARLSDPSMGEQDVQTTGNRMRSYLVNIGQVWSPEYIPRSNPIMSCCLIVPGTLRALSPDLNPQAGGLVELMLTHYSKYWKLGTRGLALLHAIRQGKHLKRGELSAADRDMMRRFSVLLPLDPPKKEFMKSPPDTRTAPNMPDPNAFATYDAGNLLLADLMPNLYDPSLSQMHYDIWSTSSDIGLPEPQHQTDWAVNAMLPN